MGCANSSSLETSDTPTSASSPQQKGKELQQAFSDPEKERAFLRQHLYDNVVHGLYEEEMKGQQYDLDELVEYGVKNGRGALMHRLTAEFGHFAQSKVVVRKL